MTADTGMLLVSAMLMFLFGFILGMLITVAAMVEHRKRDCAKCQLGLTLLNKSSQR